MSKGRSSQKAALPLPAKGYASILDLSLEAMTKNNNGKEKSLRRRSQHWLGKKEPRNFLTENKKEFYKLQIKQEMLTVSYGKIIQKDVTTEKHLTLRLNFDYHIINVHWIYKISILDIYRLKIIALNIWVG